MRAGWEIKKLGEVVEVLDKLRRPITKRDRIEGDYPYYGATGILSYVQGYIFTEKLVLIGEDGAKWDSGDKTSFIAEGKYWVNNHAHVVRPIRKIILDEWIVYFLNFSDLTPFITGMTVPKLNQEKMRGIPIPLPPLPEQQRIVTILDEAFAAIAKANANAEQNLKNAKELFESYLQGVFEKKGEGWEAKNLGEVAKFSQGIQVGLEHHISEPKNGYVRFIRIIDYTQDTDDIRFVPDPGQKYFVNKDDVVMVRYGSPGMIGRGKEGVIANNLFKIIIEKTGLSNDFLCLCLSQKHIQSFLSTQGSATMPALNFGQLKNVLIDFPTSISEQQSIVRQLDALRAETQRLEAIYQQKLADLEELKKSILQKAFAGELKTEVEVRL